MRGIVVEINQNDAVVLTDAGIFEKIRDKQYEIGQTITIRENRKAVSRWVAGAAGMVAAAAVCTIGTFAYYTPTDYVSLDVNPSIEYSVNLFDRILSVNAQNDDGEEILSDLDLKNKLIEEGVKETLDQLIIDGYLTDAPDSGVVITTSNDKQDEAEQLAAELEQEVVAYLDGRDDVAAEVKAEAVRPERVQEAKELGVTPGKLNLVDRLQESTSGAIDKEDWLTRPVKEINKAIKENRRKFPEQTWWKNERNENEESREGFGRNINEKERDPDRRYLDEDMQYNDWGQKDKDWDPDRDQKDQVKEWNDRGKDRNDQDKEWNDQAGDRKDYDWDRMGNGWDWENQRWDQKDRGKDQKDKDRSRKDKDN